MDKKIDLKRKYSVISMPQKLEALRRIDNGASMTYVAMEMGVSRTTIFKWKKKRSELEKWCSTNAMNSLSLHQSKMVTPANQGLDEALFIWFTQTQMQGAPISGPIIQAQALYMNREMGGNKDFAASDGWLSRWKTRHGVRQLAISSEKLSADESGAEEFTNSFLKIVEHEQLTPDQVFNCDETGLNYNIQLMQNLNCRNENTAPLRDNHKERVTVLACCNASGSLKLPLMVIGKSGSPRALRNIKMNRLPVFYRSQRSAWMNSQLFKEWFNMEFVPRVMDFLQERGLPPKAILVIDNAPSHPPLEEITQENIETLFFPPNVASLVQPMDQGVLENLKRQYRRKLMASILEVLDDGEDVIEHLKTITMKEVIFWLADAWEQLTTTSIKKSWEKAWPRNQFSKNIPEAADPDDQQIEVEFLKNFHMIRGCDNINESDLQDWVLKGGDTLPILSDTEIITMVMEDLDEDELDVDLEEPSDVKPIMHKDAKTMCERLLNYFVKQDNALPSDLAILRRLGDVAGTLQQCSLNVANSTFGEDKLAVKTENFFPRTLDPLTEVNASAQNPCGYAEIHIKQEVEQNPVGSPETSTVENTPYHNLQDEWPNESASSTSTVKDQDTFTNITSSKHFCLSLAEMVDDVSCTRKKATLKRKVMELISSVAYEGREPDDFIFVEKTRTN